MAKAPVGSWGEGSGEGTEVKTNPKNNAPREFSLCRRLLRRIR